MAEDKDSAADRLRALTDSLAPPKRLSDTIARIAVAPPVSLPGLGLRPPVLDLPSIPTPKERNEFQSSGVLVRRMAETVRQWRAKVPNDSQPVVLALLQGGIQINVSLLAEESFHVLRIEGTIDGDECMLLTHQASVQLLCFVQKIEQEDQRRQIGFITDGKRTSE